MVDLSHGRHASATWSSAINAAGVGGVTATPRGQRASRSRRRGGRHHRQRRRGGTTAADLGILTPDRRRGGGSGQRGGPPAARHAAHAAVAPCAAGRASTRRGLIDHQRRRSRRRSTRPRRAATVEDLLNAINGSKPGVRAQVNAAGDGIDIVNPTQGTQTDDRRERRAPPPPTWASAASTPATPLLDLNGGKGVGTAAGADFQSPAPTARRSPCRLDGAQTVQDVIDAINTADGGGGPVDGVASPRPGNGIVLTDTTGGPGTLAVTAVNASTAAADLGLTGAGVAATTSPARTSTPSPPTGVFANLAKLARRPAAATTSGITAAGEGLQEPTTTASSASAAQAGASAGHCSRRQTQLDDENLATQVAAVEPPGHGLHARRSRSSRRCRRRCRRRSRRRPRR